MFTKFPIVFPLLSDLFALLCGFMILFFFACNNNNNNSRSKCKKKKFHHFCSININMWDYTFSCNFQHELLQIAPITCSCSLCLSLLFFRSRYCFVLLFDFLKTLQFGFILLHKSFFFALQHT